MVLPKLDLFSSGPITVFESSRCPTIDECKTGKYRSCDMVGANPKSLCTNFDIARWACDHSTDVRNELESRLRFSTVFSSWRKAMPAKVPDELKKYRNCYAKSNLQSVDDEIKNIGCELSIGQVLFHGGCLNSGLLVRPLSTTFCPEVARQEAQWGGKHNKIGAVNVYVITITCPGVFAYVYNQNARLHGDELEVLIASGSNLNVGKVAFSGSMDNIPFNVVESTLG